MSPDGTLALAWKHHPSGGVNGPSTNRLYLRVRPVHRSWQPVLTLGAEGEPTHQGDGPPGVYMPGPRVATNARDDVFAVWQWPDHQTFYPRAAVVTRASHWRRPRFVSLPQAGLNPVIAADDRGAATILWQSTSSSGAGAASIEQAGLSAEARLSAIRRVGAGAEPVMAIDERGDLAAAWSAPTAAAYRPAQQRWCPPLSLGQSPEVQIAIAPDGVAQVIWHRASSNEPTTAIEARTLTRCRP